MKLLLGTMTWGYSAQTSKNVALEQLRYLATKKPAGAKIVLDTARVYQMGQCEELIGDILQENIELAKAIEVHSKAHPNLSKFDLPGLEGQLTKSLQALKIPSLGVFYLHSPDIKTPLYDTLKACNILYKRGMFKELGLSNYAAWDVCRAYYICKMEGWCVPSVYQGCYNMLSRSAEAELIPALRACNMRFYVFNPLAGGVLSGKYRKDDLHANLQHGRFSADFDFIPHNVDSPWKGKGHLYYKKRYFNETMFEALSSVKERCDTKNLKMAEVSIRWLRHHSQLKDGDGIIIGCSKLEHCTENVQSFFSNDKLDEQFITASSQAWDTSRFVAEAYFHGYGPDPGSSDSVLDQLSKTGY